MAQLLDAGQSVRVLKRPGACVDHLPLDWLSILSEETGQPLPRWEIPYPLALMVAWCSETWADYVSRKMPMATITGVRLTRRNMFFDSSVSVYELGLQPRPIREAARDAITWYRSQGWL